eukprot:g2426.t1
MEKHNGVRYTRRSETRCFVLFEIHFRPALAVWIGDILSSDSLMIFSKNAIHIITGQKKLEHLEVLVDGCRSQLGLELELIPRPKYSDNANYLNRTLELIKSAGPNYCLGLLSKEKHLGKLADDWTAAVVSMQDHTVDLAPAISSLLACKEEEEIKMIRKAAFLACKVAVEHVVVKLEQSMESETRIMHSELSSQIQDVIIDPKKHGIKLLSENCDIAFEPLFQSGGEYEIKLGMPSDDSKLKEGCIVMMLGTRYDSYCAVVGRSFFVDAPQKVKDEYNALLAAEEAGINALVPGTPLKAVREAVVRSLTERNMDHLADNLCKIVGFVMGTELRDSLYGLNNKNKRIVKPKMIFHISILVTGLEWKVEGSSSSRQKYALFLMDTVLVNEGDQPPEVLTGSCKKTWSDISYYNEKDVSEEEKSTPKTNPVILEHRLRRRDGKSDDEHLKENHRRAIQSELQELKNKETLDRLLGLNIAPANSQRNKGHRSVLKMEAYKQIQDIPASKATQPLIQTDRDRECVLLPLFGMLVPFHVKTIRNVNSQADGDRAYIRLNFNFGGGYEPSVALPKLAMLKELSFRTTNVHHASKIVQEVKSLKLAVISREKERVERAALVVQEDLIRGKRIFKLTDIWIRPSTGMLGKKSNGQLEAHHNGFRYIPPRGNNVDLMYKNIRFAFFQPASKELLTILHFQLHDPIMVGKKITSYIQFYSEITDIVQTVEGGRRSTFDPDEIEEELREKERVHKINQEFQVFVKRVQEHWAREFSDLKLEFDSPFRELGFYGVPYRSNVFMMPTVNCLVELTEIPPTVVPVEDIEIVNLERVGFNLKNFDITIVFKDFEKDVLRIDTVPSTYLDTVKDWLTSVKVKYYETKMNLAWRPILKNIMDDPQGFYESGGWGFLDMDASDEEEEEVPDADSEFDPSEVSEEESTEEDSSESASLVDSDDSMNKGSEEEESEEDRGMTWDELEAQAKKDDKRFEHDSDEEHRYKKRKNANHRMMSVKKMRM